MTETTAQPLRRRSADPRVEPWIPGHTVEFKIDGTGEIMSRANCVNAELAACRLWCPTCEELCCCFQDWHDSGHCLAIEWFDAVSQVIELYVGPERQVVSGPIEVRWDSSVDSWTWRYPTKVDQA